MGALSKLQAYNFATLLAKPFENWDAFKFGIIDDNGEILRKPKSPAEKSSMDTFENLVRKIKIILLKYLPSKKFLSFMIAAYLLKTENSHEHLILNELNCIDELNKNLTDKEAKILYTILTTYAKLG